VNVPEIDFASAARVLSKVDVIGICFCKPFT